jgi:membrane protein DedA with SNARE-associated domain
MIEEYTQALVDFIRVHEVWAAPIVGVLAFGESLAFISLLLPAWAMLVAIGALVSGSGISLWPILVAGAVGAALGDWLSYWVGIKVGPASSRCRSGRSRRRTSHLPSSGRRCCSRSATASPRFSS